MRDRVLRNQLRPGPRSAVLNVISPSAMDEHVKHDRAPHHAHHVMAIALRHRHRRQSPRLQRAPSTPARCTRRSANRSRAIVRSAAWRSSRCCLRSTKALSPELVDFTRRFGWTLPLTVVVTIFAMAGHRPQWLAPATQSWAELVLSAPVVWWAGWPFFVRWRQSLANRSPNMWTLIGTGVGIAWLYSAVATLAPQVFPASFMRARSRRRVLRSRRGDRVADAARTGAGAARALGHFGRDQGPARAGAEDRTPTARRRHRRRRAAGAGACRRSPARAARREGAGRRRRARRPLERRRVDADRRADSGEKGRRRAPDRRDDQRHRQPRSCAPRRSARRRCSRRSCRWSPPRSVRARRCSGWPTRVSYWFVLAVAAIALATFLVWGLFGPEPVVGVRHDQCDRRADHRLSVRAGTGDADVRDGRDRPRGDIRRAVQGCRSDRAPAQDRHADRRQDRHADGRQTCVRARSSPRPDSGEEQVLRAAASLDQGSEHPLAEAIVAEARRRDVVAGNRAPTSSRAPVSACAARWPVRARPSATRC